MRHESIARHRDEIISRCRAKVATRSVPPPTEVEIDHGVPVFLDQLTDALRLGDSTSSDIARTAVQHGHDLLLQGFTVSQVVHDYGDVCQAITDLAVALNAPISTDDFRTMNRCLDDAIAGAVTEYGRERNQAGIDGEVARANERTGKFSLRSWVTSRRTPSSSRALLRRLPSAQVRARTEYSSRLQTNATVSRPRISRNCFGRSSNRPRTEQAWDLVLRSADGALRHEGRIYARNLPNRGCVFTVDLPRIQVPASVND